MVVTMGAISMMLITTAAAVQSVTVDQPIGANDRDRKAAYAAAEAGLQVYVHKLLDDNTYWAKCDGVPGDGLNQPWVKSGPADTNDPREWMKLPDNSAQWTIEMLPVLPYTKCDTKNPEASMIAPGAPTFRIRVTGQAEVNTGTALAPNWKPFGPKRSLIATFKRKSFLDYIYFTNYETQDPSIFDTSQPAAIGKDVAENPGMNPNAPYTARTLDAWGQDACANYAYVKAVGNKPDGYQYRIDQRFKGTVQSRSPGSRPTSQQFNCLEITFADNDVIQGPFHTNDTPQICGSPTFGRSPTDVIEISGPGNTAITTKSSSWRTNGASCAGSVPDVNFDGDTSPNPNLGTWKFNQKTLKLPKSNQSIKAEALPTFSFLGRTTLTLTTGGIIATGTRKDGTVLNKTNIGYPANGVVYVDNATCTDSYSAAQPDLVRSGCGIAAISGTYGTDLTIAAADDIIITDDILRSGTAVLGLVANNFIRVNHPVVDQTSCASGNNSANATGTQMNLEIDAALLTLQHSFIVDNWQCGTALGKLTVNGAIAQNFRGPVATGSGKAISTGYIKNYVYDDRLRVRIPPKFIDPVESAWGIQTYQEQVPAQ